jgi:hypothetical protein
MTRPTQANKFHLPLHPQDSPIQTAGCRTNPNVCGRKGLPVCALVRADRLCLAPPSSWPRQYARLLAGAEKTAI